METRENSEKSSVVVSLQGGASIVQCKPQFSTDSKYLICPSGHVIKVLSIKSGECVHVLKGHSDRVTGIQINASNHNQIFTCSLDKTLIKWDYRDGVFVRKYKLKSPVCHLFVPETSEQKIYAVLKRSKTVHDLVSLTPPAKNKDPEVNVLSQVSGARDHVAVSRNGEFAAHVDGRTLTVCRLGTFENKKTKVHHYKGHRLQGHLSELTCVECHPKETSVVTGVKDGKILVWYNIFSSNKVVMNVNHWHSLAVQHLCFTTEGSYLLSGGHECVLVKWHWTTHHKDFLPRLGSPIINIACSHDNSHYALCHMNNGIQVVSSSSKIVQSLQGLNQANTSYTDTWGMAAGLNVDPKTNAIVTNGQTGHLQFYDVLKDQQLCMLDIVRQNYVNADSLDKSPSVTHVECLDFDSAGDWMATVERWDNGVLRAEIRLKFWVYVPATKGYKLNTLVDLPHDKEVTVLKFQPRASPSDMLMAVTAAKDGYFKLWALVDDTDIYRTSQCWSCESVGFYREEIPGALDFSEDGTLLAVAFGMTLTLWQPETATMHKVFSLPGSNKEGKISHVVFGRASCSHYLIVSTAKTIYVWNLLTCSVTRTLPTDRPVVIQSPVSEIFAVFSSRSLTVYKPDSPKPLYSHNNLSHPVKAAVFVPCRQEDTQTDTGLLAWQRNARLYFMTSQQELMTFQYADDLAEKGKSINLMSQELPQTPFSVLFGQKTSQSRSGPGNADVLVDRRAQESYAKEILSMPAHVMPPTTSLVSSFVGSLLWPSDKNAAEDADDEPEPRSEKHRRSRLTDDDRDSSDSDMDVDQDPTDTNKQETITAKMDSLKITSDPKQKKLSKLYRKQKAKTFTWL